MPEQLQPLSSTGDRPSPIERVDPRLRLSVAVALSLVIVLADEFAVLCTALAAGVIVLATSRISPRIVLARLLPLNVVMLLLLLLLPLTTPGTVAVEIGPLEFSHQGFRSAVTITLKGNAVVLTFLVLLGSMDAVTLGHALSHLRVPDKLTHLLLLTVRYLDVLHREFLRLRGAMKVRGFRPRMNRHTYRSYGYLVGMLLVRSLDRSERITAAMKCRGFRGHFYMLDHFALSTGDLPFCFASAGLLAALAWMQWT